VQIHYSFHNGQPKAGACDRRCTRRIYAVKTIEQSRQMFRRNARAIVLDYDFDAFRLRKNLNTHVSAGWRVFQRVSDHVADRPPKKRAIREKLRVAGEAEFDFQFSRLQFVIGKQLAKLISYVEPSLV
jgi:hypothetical protein